MQPAAALRCVRPAQRTGARCSRTHHDPRNKQKITKQGGSLGEGGKGKGLDSSRAHRVLLRVASLVAPPEQSRLRMQARPGSCSLPASLGGGA